ncbi:MAG TPA: DUF1080 domain-containing protein [bacterium]|nr:DUF1080 domain-containing protein [bacterium]HQL62409.1 DUF1080 domain-containing protein [bacterium]
MHSISTKFLRFPLFLCLLLLIPSFQADAARLWKDGKNLINNDGPFALWGVDISSAALSDERAKEAIDALNVYAKYGVGSIALSFQPSGTGRGVFAEDGSIGDPALFDRILRIQRAAEERWMPTVIRVFSGDPAAALSPAACERALSDLGKTFKRTRAVALNLGTVPSPNDLKKYVDLLRQGKEGFPGIIGADMGQILDTAKIRIRSPQFVAITEPVDALFWDRSLTAPIPSAYIQKPVIVSCVAEDPEVPGKPHPQLNLVTEKIAGMKGAYLIGRFPSICEGDSPRFDIGGQSAESGTGIAWFLKAVCAAQLALHGPIPEDAAATRVEDATGVLEPGEKEEGFVPLFDGRTLKGWTTLSDSWQSFSVQNGEIACDGTAPNTYLRTQRQYKDFILRVEVKISEGGNSGIFVRAPLWGRSSRIAFEIQVLGGTEADPRNSFGAVYNILGPKEDAAKGPGEWNAFEIECRGPQVRIILNGKEIHNFNVDDIPQMKDRIREGVIGLQDHRCKVWFRKIRIKEL